jgi:NAD(P)H-hydrate epimerase
LERRIAVLCGRGNNGGGGMVAARHLHNWGASVWVHLTSDEVRLKEIPAHQWKILRRMNIAEASYPKEVPQQYDLILDAIIGYGLEGDPHGEAAEWITWANHQGPPILALDTPSGLDTTTGKPGSPAILASSTLTLGLPKTGLTKPEAKPYVGRLYLGDISVPANVYRRVGIEIGPVFQKETIVELSLREGIAGYEDV